MAGKDLSAEERGLGAPPASMCVQRRSRRGRTRGHCKRPVLNRSLNGARRSRRMGWRAIRSPKHPNTLSAMRSP